MITEKIILPDRVKIQISQTAIHSIFSKLSKVRYGILGRSLLVWLLMESNQSKGYQKDYYFRVFIIPILIAFYVSPAFVFSNLYGSLGGELSIGLCSIMLLFSVFSTRKMLLKEILSDEHKSNIRIALKVFNRGSYGLSNFSGIQTLSSCHLKVLEKHINNEVVNPSSLKAALVQLITILDEASLKYVD